MIRRHGFDARLCRSVFGPGFSGGKATATTETTVAGLSTDPGQVLGTGLDGGVLLVGADIIGAIDSGLGGIAWRQGDTELVLSYDAGTREIGITGGTATVLPLATGLDAGLMAPLDKARLDGIEPGATADQTGAEIAAAIEGDAAAVAALAAALSVPSTPADLGAAAEDHAHLAADIADLPALGTAATADTADFATAAQGTLADTALQPGAPATALATDPVSAEAGDLAVTPADARRFVKMTGAGQQTVTFESGSLAAHEYLTLVKTGSGTLDLAAGSGAVLVNATGGSLTGIPQGSALSVKATEVAGEYIVVGAGG